MAKIKFGKINKMGEATWVLGVFLVGLGVCLCKKADLGVSMIAAPAFIVYEAVASLWSGFSVGMLEYLVQGALLVILCITVQRFNWRYLLAFLVAVIYGYVLDMWLLILGPEPFEELYVRWIMLIVGDMITAAGVACYFKTYLPLQVYELFVAETADRYRIKVGTVKWIFDFGCLTLSVILAFSLFGDAASFDWSKIYSTAFHSLGLGTLVTTLINAPIITFISGMMDKVFGYEPLIPKLANFIALKRKDEETNAEAGTNKDELTREEAETRDP